MKCLVVNAYSDTPEGNKKFETFLTEIFEVYQNSILTQGFKKHQHSGFSMPHVSVRDKSNLDDHLYESNTAFTRDEAKKVN